MGKSKQKLLLEHYHYNFHNDNKFRKRKIKGNKKKKKQNQRYYYKENIYDDMYFWGKEIRIAYNYRCVYCGTARHLSGHHLFYKSKFPGLKYNLSNGILLCNKCHIELHKLNDINS